ncbi:hypothetical protein BD779DRAFT_1613963 [Infundibulicybe gibba]|nr:hypothetical protein BD779DRAFT_1613963 [Infundibulicybe gibba]
MARHRKKSYRCFALSDSDEADDTPAPPPVLSIPSSQFRGLPSGNFGVTSSIVRVPSSPPRASLNSDTVSHHNAEGDSNRLGDPELGKDEFDHLESAIPVSDHQPKRDAPDNLLLSWIPDRDRYVAEDLRWEGCGDYPSNHCGHCRNQYQELYRCTDCDGGQLLCCLCIQEVHRCNALHRISVWNGRYFAKTNLKALGLRVQLGHQVGEPCLSPQPACSEGFTVIDINGIHEVALDFCNCQTAQLHFVQLLRYRWLPATVSQPKTACTFRALKHFQILSFESKTSAFEFYSTLVRLTVNTGINPPKDRYRSLILMIRIYRHIKMLKRSGKGHDPGGAMATKPGECAVMCPACPQPGMNLPPGWEHAETSKRYLYCLFLGVDANFRLKRKNVSSDKVDPGLGDGWAYFVGEGEFKEFLRDHGNTGVQASLMPCKPSTCSNHAAVNADRSGKGLAASGVGTVDCARHDGKLFEIAAHIHLIRYSNMDYFFFSSICNTPLIDIVVSYDIACQWSVKLWDRMKTYPHRLQVDSTGQKTFSFLIPKFHLPAHVMACQFTFSFNYNRYVGRTDGEAPERGWSHNNPIASSVKEMGPGSHRDTMDDHFGDWNWKKTSLMGMSLLQKIKVAVKERNDRRFLHNQFEAGLPDDDVKQWKIELDAWELDHSSPNPYERCFKKPTQDAIRRTLAAEEAESMKQGTAYVLHADVSAHMLITMGLDLEEQQWRLADDYSRLGQHATDDHTLRAQNPTEPPMAPDHSGIEQIPLYLPSAAPIILCDSRLHKFEWQLRCAQANDALDELRNSLRLRSYLYIDKDRFQRGLVLPPGRSVTSTRKYTIIQRIDRRVSVAAKKYTTAQAALLVLAPILKEADICNIYPKLQAKDIRGLSEADDNAARGGRISEGRRKLSWIWMHLGDVAQADNDAGLHDALRIEWCKSKARADRWSEEVELLREEMRHVCAFFESRAVEWERRAKYTHSVPNILGLVLPTELALIQGRIAYAMNQAAQFRVMGAHCQALWRFVDGYIQSEERALIPPELVEDSNDV